MLQFVESTDVFSVVGGITLRREFFLLRFGILLVAAHFVFGLENSFFLALHRNGWHSASS